MSSVFLMEIEKDLNWSTEGKISKCLMTTFKRLVARVPTVPTNMLKRFHHLPLTIYWYYFNLFSLFRPYPFFSAFCKSCVFFKLSESDDDEVDDDDLELIKENTGINIKKVGSLWLVLCQHYIQETQRPLFLGY